MTSRILSRHGNVIAADFRPRSLLNIDLSCKTEVLFEDDHVLLTRTTASANGKRLGTITLAGNKATGHIVQL